jgi:hypothetical protein
VQYLDLPLLHRRVEAHSVTVIRNDVRLRLNDEYVGRREAGVHDGSRAVELLVHHPIRSVDLLERVGHSARGDNRESREQKCSSAIEHEQADAFPVRPCVRASVRV